MITSWTAMTAMGCAVGMQTSSDPESGSRSVTIGTGTGGGVASGEPALDRSLVPDVGDPPLLQLP